MDGQLSTMWCNPILTCSSQANAIGRGGKTCLEYLEKHHTDPENLDDEATIKLAAQTLLEVVESGAKNIEIAVMRRTGLEILSDETVEALCQAINAEKEAKKAAASSAASVSQ